MQLTTILAVLFSCLVLFASIDYTSSTVAKGKSPVVRREPFIKSRDHRAIPQGGPLKNGRRQFAARAIVESLKQRRQR